MSSEEGGGGAIRSAAVRLLGPARFAAARSTVGTVRWKELRAPFPLGVKLPAWRRGFKASTAALYGLGNVESGQYVSDYQRRALAPNINPTPTVFDHKLVLHRLLAAAGIRQPEVVAFVSRHGVLLDPVGDGARYGTPAELAEQLVREGGRYIYKPEGGTQGKRILLLDATSGQLTARRGAGGRPFAFPRASAVPMLVERAVEQHAFWQALSPYSVNTLRILTLWTPGDAGPFIARAVQRVGTEATLPTDNWSGGGVCALVDRETGRLGPGRVNPYKSGREDRPYPRHPDSGGQIEGAVLPGWDAIAALALAAARSLPFAPYVGWDVAVDAGGTPLVIEGNNNTDVDLLQVHGGLLADPAVRRFYEVCGIL